MTASIRRARLREFWKARASGDAERAFKQGVDFLASQNGDGPPEFVKALAELAFDLGRTSQGVDFARRLAATAPGRSETRALIAEANFHLGHYDKALEGFGVSVPINDLGARGHRLRVLAMAARKADGPSAKDLEAMVRATSSAEELISVVDVLIARKLLPAASHLLKRALARFGARRDLMVLQARVMQKLGLSQEALDLATNAIDPHASDEGDALFLGALMHGVERYRDAYDVFCAVLERFPASPRAFFNKAMTAQFLSLDEEAEAAFRKAHALDPSEEQVGFGYVNFLAQSNKHSELEALIEKAQQSRQSANYVRFADAVLARAKGDFEQVLASLDQIPPYSLNPKTRSIYEATYSQALDRLGRFDEAFERKKIWNEALLASPGVRSLAADQYLASIKAAADDVERHNCEFGSSIRAQDNFKTDEGMQLVFQVGFPRSGTTLLDTLLQGSPDVTVYEELPTLAGIRSALASSGYSYGEAVFAALQDPAPYQKLYAGSVKALKLPQARIQVDKMPLNLQYITLLAAIFPHAKFIVCLRHPLDSILSCFFQAFHLNQPMANMLSLTSASQLYDHLFRQYMAMAPWLGDRVIEVRYEDLVERPDQTLTAVGAFLGSSMDFDAADLPTLAARRGRISTPSYHQVSRPVYKESVDRWRNYARHLGSARDNVDRWLREFGYSGTER